MRQWFISTAAVMLSCSLVSAAPLGSGSGGSGAAGKPEKLAEHKLPKDPKAVVVSLDFKGGYGPQRKNNAPTLSILANGSILIPDNYGVSKDVKSEMSQIELQQLLHFIIVDNQFLKYNSAKVAAAKKKAMQPKVRPGGGIAIGPVVADAATTSIYVHADGQKNEASEYALSMYANGQFKEIKELQQLLAIQKRLQRVMSITHGGGANTVNKMLALGNIELKKKYPKAKPLTIDHFQYAGPFKTGKLYMFRRFKPGPKANPRANTYVNVRIEAPAGGDPKFIINAKLK